MEIVAAFHVGCKVGEPAGCAPHRQYVRFVPPITLPILYNFVLHNDCQCNERIGITNRVLGVVPLPTERGLRLLRLARRKISSRLPKVAELTTKQVTEKMTGRRKRRYENAAEVLRWETVERKDSIISAFVKAEKVQPAAKPNPDPRIIQFRGAKYTLRLMQFLKPAEHALYQIPGPSGLRAIAKGLNNIQRAELIVEKFDQFGAGNCVALSIDAKRWDKHLTKEVLKIEHAVYLAMHGNDPTLAQLLSWQLRNRCFTRSGISYVADGNRMSGDANTALGNCLLMVIMVHAAMADLHIRKWDIFDDGDDCLLFVPLSCEEKLASLTDVFCEFGQELKLENRATVVEKIIFCQHQPVLLDGGWTMVQNPSKVLSTRAGGTSHWTNPGLFRGMLHATGLCELSLSRGVPILQEYALALLRMGDGTIPKAFADDLEVWTRALRMGRLTTDTLTISTTARDSFADAFDIDIADQLWIEEELRSWNYIHRGQYLRADDEMISGWQQEEDLRL